MKKVLLNSEMLNSTKSFFFRCGEYIFMRIDINEDMSIHDNLSAAIDMMHNQCYDDLNLYASITMSSLLSAEIAQFYRGVEGITMTIEKEFPALNSVTWFIPDSLKSVIEEPE